MDEYFNFCYGKLDYRSLQFEHISVQKKFYQSCQQINYPNENLYTRIIEWKHATKQNIDVTSIMKEYPEDYSEGKEMYYPVGNNQNKIKAEKYLLKARKIKNVYFIGRLAEYRYYNVDQVITRSLKFFETIAKS